MPAILQVYLCTFRFEAITRSSCVECWSKENNLFCLAIGKSSLKHDSLRYLQIASCYPDAASLRCWEETVLNIYSWRNKIDVNEARRPISFIYRLVTSLGKTWMFFRGWNVEIFDIVHYLIQYQVFPVHIHSFLFLAWWNWLYECQKCIFIDLTSPIFYTNDAR